MTAKIKIVSKKEIGILQQIFEIFIVNSKEPRSPVHLEKFISDERTNLFTVFHDDQVIGFALAYRFHSIYSSGDLAYLYDIEILLDQRRKGIGRLLMDFLLNHLKSAGVTELWLGTATDNIAAQTLFARMGGIKSDETFKEYTFQL